jgi:cysteine-rich repeat protein
MRKKVTWGKAIRSVLLTCLWLSFYSQTVHAAGAADDHTVLILDSTVSGGAASSEATKATAAGFSVEVVDGSGWAAKSSTDFATYRAIVLGDATCNGVGAIAAAEANKTTWGSVINGNIILVGTDPVYHENFTRSDIGAVTDGAVKFAADIPGKTGAYISLSCYYHGTTSATPVSVLDPFGTFTVTGVGCYDDAHKVADHPALTGITDVTLSNWSCSVHEAFDNFPASFLPLAIAQNIGGPGSLTFADGTFGIPYILARGGDLVPAACGDGTVQPPEECDDDNIINGDGCSAQCKIERCGDGFIQPGLGETCDDGNTENGDGCSATCQIESDQICGNEVVEGTEECDDGNTESGDGCSSTCQIEDPCVAACVNPAALHVNAANRALVGTSGDDILCGDDRNNTLRGQGGDDLLCGFGGNDFLQGGDGNDIVYGGKGNDTLYAGSLRSSSGRTAKGRGFSN